MLARVERYNVAKFEDGNGGSFDLTNGQVRAGPIVLKTNRGLPQWGRVQVPAGAHVIVRHGGEYERHVDVITPVGDDHCDRCTRRLEYLGCRLCDIQELEEGLAE